VLPVSMQSVSSFLGVHDRSVFIPKTGGTSAAQGNCPRQAQGNHQQSLFHLVAWRERPCLSILCWAAMRTRSSIAILALKNKNWSPPTMQAPVLWKRKLAGFGFVASLLAQAALLLCSNSRECLHSSARSRSSAAAEEGAEADASHVCILDSN